MSARPYDEIGTRILTDEEIDAADAAWNEDHPGDRPGGIRTRALGRNAALQEEAEAEAAGTTVEALRRAKAEERSRQAAKREAEDLATARRFVRPRGHGPAPDALASFEAIEAKRLELARDSKPHGYDSLAKACKVSRSLVRDRYRGRTPPGEAPY